MTADTYVHDRQCLFEFFELSNHDLYVLSGSSDYHCGLIRIQCIDYRMFGFCNVLREQFDISMPVESTIGMSVVILEGLGAFFEQ